MLKVIEMEPIQCQGCGVWFTPHDTCQKYHDKACRGKHNSRQSYRRNPQKYIDYDREYRAKKKPAPAMAEKGND